MLSLCIRCDALRQINNKQIYLKLVRYCRQASSNNIFYPHRHGWEYDLDDPDIPWKERVIMSKDYMIKESKLWIQEMKDVTKTDTHQGGFPELRHNQLRFLFNGSTIGEKFIVTTDSKLDSGFSRAELVPSPSGRGVIFRGYIDTQQPRDGKTALAGFANIMSPRAMKSFSRFHIYEDWQHFTHFCVKLRGDGRTYMIVLNTPGYFDMTWHEQFNFPLFTHGGPYWQYAKIPFSKFYFTTHARIMDRQMHLTKYLAVNSFGISLLDNRTGPFEVEIEWFGLSTDTTHKEECAYELYDLPTHRID